MVGMELAYISVRFRGGYVHVFFLGLFQLIEDLSISLGEGGSFW